MVAATASPPMETGYITPKKTKKAKSKQSSTVSTPSSTSTTSTKRSTPSNSPSESAAKRMRNITLLDSSDEDEMPPMKKNNKKKKMKKKKEEEEEEEEKKEKKKEKKKKKKMSTSPVESSSNNKLGKKKKVKSTKGSSDKSSGTGLPLLVLTNVQKLTNQDLKDIIVSDPDSNITEEDLAGMDRDSLILEWLNLYKLFEVKSLINFLHTQLQTDKAQMRNDLDAVHKWTLRRSATEALKLLKRLENAGETPSLTA